MSNLAEFSANVHRGIAAAFVGEGLSAHALTAIQAPHTLTYPFRLAQPTVSNVNKALRLGRAIESTISLSPVRVNTENGLIMVEVPSPVPVVIRGSQLCGDGLAVPVGMSSRRSIVGVDFEADSHLLIVGATNKGKTTTSRNIAYQLIRQHSSDQLQMIASCFKRKNWRAFESFAHIITDPADTLTMLESLRALMYARGKRGIETPRIVVFLDDCLNLFAHPGVDDVMKELLPLARGAGINFVLITQRLVGMSTAVTKNCTARLVFNLADTADSGIVGGRSDLGAESLGRYPGDCLLIANDGVTRVAGAYTTDEDVTALARVKQWDCTPLHALLQSRNDSYTNVCTGISEMAENDQNTHLYEGVQSSDSNRFSVAKSVQNGVQWDGLHASLHTPLQMIARLQGRPKTEVERAFVREAYKDCGGSMRATMKKVWGTVGSNYTTYINECLENLN